MVFAIYYASAPEDRLLRDRLEKHLALLKYLGFVSTWHQRELLAGSDWASEIDARLEIAHIILLLVSADFLASGYCYGVELAKALQKHQEGTARVIPILLRPVDWQDAPFHMLQMLPSNRKPVTSWRQRDEAFVDIARGIRAVIQELHAQSLQNDKVDPGSALPKWLTDEATNSLLPNVRSNNAMPYVTNERESNAQIDSRLIDSFILDEIPFISYHQIEANPNSVLPSKRSNNAQISSRLTDSFILDDTPFISYYQEALVSFQKALSGNEKDGRLYTTIADSLQAIGHHDDAIVAYVQAITLNPSMITPYYGIAKSLYYLRHPFEALRVYAMALQRDANNTAYAYMSCSLVIKQLKYDKEALAARKDALKLDPTIHETYLDWEYALLEPVQQGVSLFHDYISRLG